MTAEQHNLLFTEGTCIQANKTDNYMMELPANILGRLDQVELRETNITERSTAFDVYETNVSGDGMCGSVYLNSTQNPIFAMHVAGTQMSPTMKRGYAIPLIRETFEDLEKGQFALSYFLPRLADPQYGSPQLFGNLIPLGSLPKDKVAFMPHKSKIIPSLLQNDLEKTNGEKIPCITQPGILSPSDPRWKFDQTPLYHGCMKHACPPDPFCQKYVDIAVESLSKKIQNKCKPLRVIDQDLSMKEVIFGNKIQFYDRINFKTSSGYPYNLNVKKTKRDYIPFEEDGQGEVISFKIELEH